ncbi:MAG: MBL fold metallo-hydrolase, partial [Clostridiales bacterium]|nr:MBL fold metallo-hydrolase [Clostridiales bacterium]
MRIHFCGAAESVTGSCHLLELDGVREGDAKARILLDCGQFQGSPQQEAENYEEFPFEPATVDFLILSHAHIDHCGRIPLLVKRGFKGRIYCTDATADLLPIMLRDSAHIAETEAEWKNKKSERAGKEQSAAPLFTMDEAEVSLKTVTPVLYGQQIEPMPGVKFVFNDAGHILGSAITEVFFTEGGVQKKFVFSGDLGAEGRPMLNDPTYIKKADYVVMETTYGNRLHEAGDTSLKSLTAIIQKTIGRGGTVVIPSFAVGRTQELIYELNKYTEQSGQANILKGVKVYVDSPMAVAATEVFRKNIADFDEEAKKRILAGDDILDFANLVLTSTTDESKAINDDHTPKIIISASGMCEAGRIRHHLKHNLWNAKNSVVFVGYQAVGTLGRKIVEGAKSVSLFGEEIAVNAEIYDLEGFSAHADKDGLLKWARGFEKPPQALFLVHGEPDSKQAFAQTLRQETAIKNPVVIERICEVDLLKGGWQTQAVPLAQSAPI